MNNRNEEIGCPRCIRYKVDGLDMEGRYDVPWDWYDSELDTYFNRIESKIKCPYSENWLCGMVKPEDRSIGIVERDGWHD